MGLLSFIIIGPATANLDGSAHLLTLSVATAFALIVGFLTASAVLRRGGLTPTQSRTVFGHRGGLWLRAGGGGVGAGPAHRLHGFLQHLA